LKISGLLVLRQRFAALSFRAATVIGGVILVVGMVHNSVNATQAANTLALSSIHFGPYPPMIYPIRVGISTRSSSNYVFLWEGGALFVNEKPVFVLAPRHVYSLARGRITDLATGQNCPLPINERAYITSDRYRVWANNRWYGGVLEIVSLGGRVTLINLLDIEDYLCGVVPAEMPASWHLEALKAQAVAARSYAYAHIGPGSKWYKTEGYDVVPDTRDQMYKGQAAAMPSTNTAVWQTRSIILKNAGRVKPGFYRAWVGDSYENLNIRTGVVSKAVLEKITGVSGIIGVTVKQFDRNGNASSIQVISPKKNREVYGVALARMLHFSTAGILDIKEDGNNWIFTYRGPGNGSRGLSQHGANMLAANGWNFEQILTQYYQDADGQLRLDYMDRYKRSVPSYKPAQSQEKQSTDSQIGTE
jgi:hypothetical protein